MSESKFIPQKPSPKTSADTDRINIHFAPEAFPAQHFFNRFSVADLEGCLLVDFGLVDKSGMLVQSFAAVFNHDSLRRFRVDHANYFALHANTNGAFDKITPIPWQPSASARSAIYQADLLGLNMQELAADIDLYHLPLRKVTTAIVEKKKTVLANPIASLRSPVPVHKLLLKQILVRAEEL